MDSSRSIDARSIVTLIFFIGINVLVIFPLYIPIPYPRLRRSTTTVTRAEEKRSPASRWALYRFKLGLETAPVIGVLLLLASTCIPGSVVRAGIVGSEGVKPYDIMTLFLCFAYISLSLDSTGLLRYLAFLVGNKYSSSGSRLYLAFYAFFAITGLLIGNDPLILSGTPFLVYFTDHASIDPSTGFLFTHFQVSNLVSALLVSSNPTNLVLTSAFEISFLKYSAWTALPTVGAVIILLPILRYYVFKGVVPKTLSPPHVRAADALNDKWGGIFGAVLFLITIVLLVGLSAGGQLERHPWTGVWVVVLPAALCMLTWDCVADLRHPGRKEASRRRQIREVDRPEGSIETGRVEVADHEVREKTHRTPSPASSPTQTIEFEQNIAPQGRPSVEDDKLGQEKMPASTERASIGAQSPSLPAMEEKSDDKSHDAQRSHNHETTAQAPVVEASDSFDRPKSDAIAVQHASHEPLREPLRPTGGSDHDTTSLAAPSQEDLPAKSATMEGMSEPKFPFTVPPLSYVARTFPTPVETLLRMPWGLVPFAFSMFILVEGLQHTGWIKVFGGWWASWVRVDDTGVAGVVWLMGMLSVIGCNVFGTNIGATILLSRVLQYWEQEHGPVSRRTLYAAVYTLAVGSNFGAYSFVFSASLAGLLWRTILGQKGRKVKAMEFWRYNWLAVVVTMIVGCLIVAGEVCVIY